MAILSRRIHVYSNGNYSLENIEESIPDSPVQLYQYKEDIPSGNFDGKLRGCASGGCPAVQVLKGDPDIFFDKQWQFFLYAINFGMPKMAIQNLTGNEKALTNAGDSDQAAMYITGENLSNPPPRLDKLRTFVRNVHTGTEIGDFLKVKTFNGNYPPPLKAGRSYPETLSDINPDDYLIMPKTHRHMFLVCNNVKAVSGGSIVFPFSNGIVYDWTGDNDPYVFFPLVSWFSDVLTPLSKWIKLPLNSPIPSPYRR